MNHSLPTEAGQTNQNQESHEARNLRVDAINQVFALFRLNFHAQFFKAFATEAELNQIKKLWLHELGRFSPDALLKAAKAILETSDYLPTLHTMIRHCEAQSKDALPDAHTAYIEACRAPSPKVNYNWSHPAVYFAGKACDWYFLQTGSESTVYPVFKKKYAEICERVRAGETLTVIPKDSLEHKSAPPLDKNENLERLKALRESLDL